VYTDLQQGSGFLFDEQGDILTNAHVVKDASFITVKNNHGQEFNGWVIGISEDVDVALVRVTELKGKKPMVMETEKVAIGTDVFALGSPGNMTNTATEGKITATGLEFFDDYAYTDLYEMNATIKEGSSGGPLIDKNTERVIGINSIILNDNPKIGYAIPIYSVVDQLKKWIANPKKDVDWAGQFESNVKDAYFEEGLLRTFIEGYYELLIYSLNDNAVNYYTSYILPNSQAATVGEKHITDYSADSRIFSAVKPTIERVDIKGAEAVVEASVVYNYTDQFVKEVQQLTQRVSYTIVIDEFGDYQIKQIVNK
jgi:serine protease Do